ncbi:unnamed protein product [Closterium sp. Naga37s-1]|nr:unnamed protein product [Closterium sp. Naga37s-1]
MVGLAGFRSLLLAHLPDCIPLVPFNHPSSAIVEYSAGIHMKPLELREGSPPQPVLGVKCVVAPMRCAEAMIFEWMAEPRVGVLMDLGRIRSHLPAILAITDSATTAPAPATAAGSDAASGTWATRWAAYRRAVSFAAFLMLVVRCPRVVNLRTVSLYTHSAAYPAIMQLGATRQIENDCFASMLVQVLGVKESADLQEGFGFFVQHLLLGGLEKAHAEGRGGAEGEAAENAQGEEGRADGEVMDRGGGMEKEEKQGGDLARLIVTQVDGGGGKDRGDKGGPEHRSDASRGDERQSSEVNNASAGGGGSGGKNGQWRENLKGREWEKYVDGMAWILAHGGGTTDFALALAMEMSKPESCIEAVLYVLDGNNANKVRVEEAAIEEARSRLRRGVGDKGRNCDSGGIGGEWGVAGTSGAAASTSGAAEASAMWYASSRPDGTGSSYSSDILIVKGCSGSRRQKGILQMPHPFRDLPSLLLRLGATPKPLDDANFSMEWEEWSQGDESAAKLPDDPDARFFQLGIVEESSTGVESGQGVREQDSKSGRKHIREKGQKAKASGKGSDVRGGDTNRGFGEDQGGVSHASGMTVARPSPARGEVPMIRCVEDAEFIVDAISLVASPPACAKCIRCYRSYTSFIPSIALVAKFAYRPLGVLLNRFLSVFLPHSAGFDKLVKAMGLSPFPPGPPALANLARLRGEIEAERLGFFMFVALTWPASILDMEQFESKRAEGGDGIRVKKRVGRKKGKARGEEEEDDGEVWEELQSWCYTAKVAWPSAMRVALSNSNVDSARSGLSGVCTGSEGRQKRAHVDTRLANIVNTGAAKRIRQRVRDWAWAAWRSSTSNSSSDAVMGSGAAAGTGSASNGSSGRGSGDGAGTSDIACAGDGAAGGAYAGAGAGGGAYAGAGAGGGAYAGAGAGGGAYAGAGAGGGAYAGAGGGAYAGAGAGGGAYAGAGAGGGAYAGAGGGAYAGAGGGAYAGAGAGAYTGAGAGGGAYAGADVDGVKSTRGKGKKPELPPYMIPWPGGVNLVACLREMLLGEPCYRHPSPTATSVLPDLANTTAAAPTTTTSASSTPAAPPDVAAPSTAASSTLPAVHTVATTSTYNGAATGTAAATAPLADTEASGSDARRGSRCGAAGCGSVEGGCVKLKSCSGCGRVAYCSRDCQKAH